MEESSILVKQEGQVGIVRVVGKGSFKNAQNLKKYIERAMLEGVHDFVIDLQDCVHMDSTFMGVMAGMGIGRIRMKQSPPRVIHASARSRELLETLGLDRILNIEHSTDTSSLSGFNPVEQAEPESKIQSARTMLQAHENLIEVKPENEAKFEDVLIYLKEKLTIEKLSS